MLLFFVIVSLLSSFLCLTLLLSRLFLFRQLQQQAGHERKEMDGRDGIYVGGNSNVGRHGGTEGTDGRLGTSSFMFLSFLLYSFILIIFLLFRLPLFRQLQQQAGHERKEPDGRGRIYVGGNSNVGRHGGTEGTDRANGYVFFYVFVLSTLLFYSYHSSSFPITSFSVEYNNGRAGRDRW